MYLYSERHMSYRIVQLFEVRFVDIGGIFRSHYFLTALLKHLTLTQWSFYVTIRYYNIHDIYILLVLIMLLYFQFAVYSIVDPSIYVF